MDKRLKFAGGEIEISSDEINRMPESNQSAIFGINNGLTETGQDMIASGVFAQIFAGQNASVQAGFVVLNGETLQVDPHAVAQSVGTDLYQFEKVTTYPIAGARDFRDNSTHNVYEQNRAVAVNVLAITTLSIVGDTLIDKLKELIRIQSDWNQNDSQEPDYIQNKPAVMNSLMKGECVFGDIAGAPTGALTVSGDLISATKATPTGNASTVVFVFPDVGSSDYTVSLNWLRQSQTADMKGWMIDNQTATSLTIRVEEEGNNVQDFNLRVHLFI